jgi:BASS family bile acid:Na+ symporter
MTSLLEILALIARLSVVIFVVSSMLAMGMSQRLSDVIAPLKDRRATFTVLAVNFIAAPLLAVILCSIVPLQPAHATGLLLLGGAAGAPFLPKLAETAGGSVAHSIALMVLLMVATIVFVPLVMPLIVPGLQADILGIAGPLVVLMLIPLGIGFALAQRGEESTGRLLELVRKVSNLFFVLFLVSLTVLQFRAMLDILGSFAIGTYLIFVLGMFALAYFVSNRDPGTRPVAAFAAAQRNISAALVVSGASFNDPAITTMVLLSAVVGLLVLMGVAVMMGRGKVEPPSIN